MLNKEDTSTDPYAIPHEVHLTLPLHILRACVENDDPDTRWLIGRLPVKTREYILIEVEE